MENKIQVEEVRVLKDIQRMAYMKGTGPTTAIRELSLYAFYKILKLTPQEIHREFKAKLESIDAEQKEAYEKLMEKKRANTKAFIIKATEALRKHESLVVYIGGLPSKDGTAICGNRIQRTNEKCTGKLDAWAELARRLGTGDSEIEAQGWLPDKFKEKLTRHVNSTISATIRCPNPKCGRLTEIKIRPKI